VQPGFVCSPDSIAKRSLARGLFLPSLLRGHEGLLDGLILTLTVSSRTLPRLPPCAIALCVPMINPTRTLRAPAAEISVVSLSRRSR